MRQIDEILWSLPGQELPAQRFLLRRVERQPVTIDASVLAAELRRLRGGELSGHLRLVEEDLQNRTLRDAIRRAGGQASLEAGAWTRFFDASDGGDGGAGDDGQGLEQVAVQDFECLVEPLWRRLESEPDRGEILLPLLGEIRLSTSLGVLARFSGQSSRDALVVAALASFGGEAAAQVAVKVMNRAIKRPEPVVELPAMVAALRHLPSAGTLTFLEKLVDRSGEIREAVAVALEGFPPEQSRPLIDRILASREGWATMNCVETMGRTGGDALTERLTRIYHSTTQPLVRALCVQAVGEARPPRAANLIEEGLGAEQPLVQAAAVEALVSLPEIPIGCIEVIRPLVTSPHPKLAMNATLAIALLEPSRALRRVQRFLSSGSPHDLLKGIHCLAYVNYPPAAGILASVVRKAPRGPMRLQALRALGRRAARSPDSFQELAGFLEHEDLEVRRSAGFFLADAHPTTREQAAGVLAKALDREDDEASACALAQALGLAAADSEGSARVLGKLVEEEDGEVSRAAGLALVRAHPQSSAAGALEGRKDPALRALACYRSWSLGEGTPEALGPLLADTPRRRLPSVVSVVREAAEAAVVVGAAVRLEKLAKRLRAAAPVRTEPQVPAEMRGVSAAFDQIGEPLAPTSALVDPEPGAGSKPAVAAETRAHVPVPESAVIPPASAPALQREVTSEPVVAEQTPTHEGAALHAEVLEELAGFLTGEIVAVTRESPGTAEEPGSSGSSAWWSGRNRRSVERPSTQVRAKGVVGDDLAEGDRVTAEGVEHAMEQVFAKPAREFSDAVEQVSYFQPQASMAVVNRGRQVRVAVIVTLLLLGLAVVLFSRPTRSTRRDAPIDTESQSLVLPDETG